MKSTRIHGKKINYDPKDRRGIDYLREDLQSSETNVFFKHARAHGSADFEDEHERQFTVVRKPDGTYDLVRRK